MHIKHMVCRVVVGLFVMLAVSSNAFAWDGTTTGTITWIQTNGDVGDINFMLTSQAFLCGTATDRRIGQIRLGYAGVTNELYYKQLVSALNQAFLAGKTVTVYAYNSGPWGCQVGAIQTNY